MNAYNDGDIKKAEKVIQRSQKQLRKRKAAYKFKGAARYDKADKEMDGMLDSMRRAPAKSSAGQRLIKSKKARSNDIVTNEVSF